MIKFLNDIKCVFLKELWQITNKKKVILSSLLIALMPLIIAFECNNSILPMDYLRTVLPVSISYITCISIMQTIIIDEINYKTLDILLTSKLSKLGIIIGKLLLGVFFGLLYSVISLILLYIASYFSPYLVTSNFITIFNIFVSIGVAIIGGLITITLSLLLKNIQSMTSSNTIILFFLIFLIYYLRFKLDIPMYIIGISLGILCVLLTLLSIKLLSTKNYTINK